MSSEAGRLACVLEGAGLVVHGASRGKDLGYFSRQMQSKAPGPHESLGISVSVSWCKEGAAWYGVSFSPCMQTCTPCQGSELAAELAWMRCSSCILIHTLFPQLHRTGSGPGTLHMQTPPPPSFCCITRGSFCQSGHRHGAQQHPSPQRVTLNLFPCTWELVVRAGEGGRSLPSYGVSCLLFFLLSFLSCRPLVSSFRPKQHIHVLHKLLLQLQLCVATQRCFGNQMSHFLTSGTGVVAGHINCTAHSFIFLWKWL